MDHHTQKHPYRTTRKKNHTTHHKKTKKQSKKLPNNKLKDDFYTTINKNWLYVHKYVYNSSKKDSVSRFSLLQEKVDKQIIHIINKICRVHSHSSPVLSNIKKIYDAVIETKPSTIEARLNGYLFELNNFIKKGCEYSKTPNNHAKYDTEYYNFLAWMNKHQFPMFIKWIMDYDVKNTSKYISYIINNGFSFGLKKMYVSKIKSDQKEIAIYKKLYIENVDSLLHYILGDNHCFNAEDIYDIERKMAEYLYEDNIKITFENSYHKISKSELKEKYNFNMNKFVDSLFYSIHKNDCNNYSHNQNSTQPHNNIYERFIILDNVKYMQYALKETYNKWHTKEWHGYFIYKIISTAIPYHKDLCRIHSIFFNNVNELVINVKKKKNMDYIYEDFHFNVDYNTITTNNYDMLYYANDKHSLIKIFNKSCKLSEIANFNVTEIMNMEINKLYMKYYKHEKEIVLVKKLIEIIKKVFRNRLIRSTWLSSNTIKHVLQKLDKINIVIGTKSTWDPDPDCDFTNVDSYGNYHKYTQWLTEQKLKKYFNHDKTDMLEKYKNKWDRNNGLNTFSVNAYFSFDKNELFIPNAILQPPYIDVNKSMIYNYANIGTLIGHELMHAFDDQGYKYDENGNFAGSGWWSPEDVKKYKEKQDKIIHFYENVAKKDHIIVSANISIGENLADIGGFLIAEEALVDHLVENKIYGEKQNIHLMEFYKYYAQYWQSIKKPKLYKNMNLLNPHSIAKYRVNCVLITSDRFNKIYDIQKNDKMYLENFTEYHIW